jgi:N utilization substance protein A
MKSEFALAFNQICAEYELPREIVLEAVQAALVSAYRRDWKISSNQNLTAEINMSTGTARVFLEKEVVEDVESPQTEVALEKARRQDPNVALGDTIMMDVTPRDFGRIAAQTAKQVIMQRLREAERESQFTRFSRQEGEIIIGTIQSIRPQGIKLHLERKEEALMPRREQIPGERYTLHQKIRVYVLEVKRTPRGPQITVSRSHPAMLRRLLELEVPEVRAGTLEIKAIAREAGTRSKIAVQSHQEGLDAVGTCVGHRGIRIQTISRELNDERIDVVEWAEEPAQFIANALSLDGVVSVVVDENAEGGRTASVVVLDDQLSLAIGRSGQNARLTAKMTGWRVDIQGLTEAALWALEKINEAPELLGSRKEIVGLVPRLASVVRTHEEQRYPYTDEERRVIRTVVEGVRHALIERRDRSRGAVQKAARKAAKRKAERAREAARERARAQVPAEAYEATLDGLDLPDKVRDHLRNNELQNVGQVMEKVALGDEALLMLSGVGAKALNQIKQAVADSAYQFTTEEPEEVEAVVEEFVVVEEAVEPEPAGAEVAVEEAVPVEAEDAVAEEVEVAAKEAAAKEAAAEEAVAEEAVAEEAVSSGKVFDAETVKALQSSMTSYRSPEELARIREELERELAELAEAEGEELDLDDLGLPDYEDFVEDEEEFDREFEEDLSRHQDVKARRRAILYDEDTGETYTVRRRRQGRSYDLWEEYRDH